MWVHFRCRVRTCSRVRDSSTSTAVGHESSYTWEGVSAAACDEILWGLLTLNRAMRDTEGLEPVNVSLKVTCAALALICTLYVSAASFYVAMDRSDCRGDDDSVASTISTLSMAALQCTVDWCRSGCRSGCPCRSCCQHSVLADLMS